MYWFGRQKRHKSKLYSRKINQEFSSSEHLFCPVWPGLFSFGCFHLFCSSLLSSLPVWTKWKMIRQNDLQQPSKRAVKCQFVTLQRFYLMFTSWQVILTAVALSFKILSLSLPSHLLSCHVSLHPVLPSFCLFVCLPMYVSLPLSSSVSLSAL